MGSCSRCSFLSYYCSTYVVFIYLLRWCLKTKKAYITDKSQFVNNIWKCQEQDPTVQFYLYTHCTYRFSCACLIWRKTWAWLAFFWKDLKECYGSQKMWEKQYFFSEAIRCHGNSSSGRIDDKKSQLPVNNWQTVFSMHKYKLSGHFKITLPDCCVYNRGVIKIVVCLSQCYSLSNAQVQLSRTTIACLSTDRSYHESS